MHTACTAAVSKIFQKQPNKDTVTKLRWRLSGVFVANFEKKNLYSPDISIVDLKTFLYNAFDYMSDVLNNIVLYG